MRFPAVSISCNGFTRFRMAGKLVALILFLVPACWAQVSGYNDNTSTPVRGVGHDYIHLLNETVNPANGSISLRVRVPIAKGRGLTMPFSFAYDSSATWSPQPDGGPGASFGTTSSRFLEADGWSYGLPTATSLYIGTGGGTPQQQCPTQTGYTFQDSTGSIYSLGLITFDQMYRYQGIYPCHGELDTTSGGSDFYGAQLPSTNGYRGNLSITDAHGTVFNFNRNIGCDQTESDVMIPASIEDRNGNEITISQANGCGTSFNATDTLGRTVLSISGFGTSGNTVAVSGLSQPYTVTWSSVPYALGLGSRLDSGTSYCGTNIVAGHGSLPVVTAITLPSGQKYQFSYDSNSGLLAKIAYPDGGYVSYTWALNRNSEFAALADTNGNSQACLYTYDTYAVSERDVSFDGASVALKQTFSYSTTWNPGNYAVWTGKGTTVTTTDEISGLSYTNTYTYTPMNAPAVRDIPSQYATQIPMEQTTKYFKDTNANGTPLKTVNKAWYDLCIAPR